jgi:hypothetical protein
VGAGRHPEFAGAFKELGGARHPRDAVTDRRRLHGARWFKSFALRESFGEWQPVTVALFERVGFPQPFGQCERESVAFLFRQPEPLGQSKPVLLRVGERFAFFVGEREPQSVIEHVRLALPFRLGQFERVGERLREHVYVAVGEFQCVGERVAVGIGLPQPKPIGVGERVHLPVRFRVSLPVALRERQPILVHLAQRFTLHESVPFIQHQPLAFPFGQRLRFVERQSFGVGQPFRVVE